MMDNSKLIGEVCIDNAVLDKTTSTYYAKKHSIPAYKELNTILAMKQDGPNRYLDTRTYHIFSTDKETSQQINRIADTLSESPVMGKYYNNLFPLLEIPEGHRPPAIEIAFPDAVLSFPNNWSYTKTFTANKVKNIASNLTKAVYGLLGDMLAAHILTTYAVRAIGTTIYARIQFLNIAVNPSYHQDILNMVAELPALPPHRAYITKYNQIGNTSSYHGEPSWIWGPIYRYDPDETSFDLVTEDSCISANHTPSPANYTSTFSNDYITTQICGDIEEDFEPPTSDEYDYKIATDPECKRTDITLTYLDESHWQGDKYKEMIQVFNKDQNLYAIFKHHSQLHQKEEFESYWREEAYLNINPEYYYRFVQIGACDEFKEEYERFVVGQLRVLLEKYNGSIADADCSKIVYYITVGQYFVDAEKKWYRFINKNSNHSRGQMYKWVMSRDEPATIGNDVICDKLRHYFEIIIKSLENEQADISVMKMISTVRSTQMRLGNVGRMKCIVKSLSGRYSSVDIDKKMDADKFIIGVQNGVLDLGLRNEVSEPKLYRTYSPYYVMKTTNSQFNAEMYESMADGIENSSHPIIQKIYKIYSQIIMEPDAFEMIMCISSTYLDDVMNVLHVLQCIANGSNGKSVYVDNILYAVGLQYMTKLSTNLVTGKIKSGQADSDFMKLEGKRGGIITETDNGERIMASRLKQISEINKQGRNLYENDKDFESNATVMLFSNYPLSIEETDEGTWRRLFKYTFKRRFISKPQYENEFLADRSLETMAQDNPDIADGILTMLVYYRMRLHNKYKDNLDNIECPTIRDETNEYRISQDSISKYLSKHIVSLGGYNKRCFEDIKERYETEYEIAVERYLSITAIATNYKQWYAKNNNREVKGVLESIEADLSSNRRLKKILVRLDGADYIEGYRFLGAETKQLEEKHLE